jgi:hypothetical protein
MLIHTDHNGVCVNAISSDAGDNVEGHLYHIQAGLQSSTIQFQLGAVATNKVNGVTNEALLAILLHRTKFLDSKFPCDENKRAIQHMEEALVNLEVRTARRMVRGVEGREVA